MSWCRLTEGRVCLRGRIPRRPVAEWLNSDDGAAAVRAAARQVRFSLLGRERSARRRLRRELADAVAAPMVHTALSAECERYLSGWTDLAYAPSLPRATVALRRIVVIPRAMILGHTLSRLTARLNGCLRLPDAADSFKGFFARRIAGEMDEAVRRAGPSLRRPLFAHDSWACVGIDRECTWVDPLWSGAEWRGHAVMFEMPVGRLQRRERRELETAIEQLTQSLAGLSRQEREHMVRAAAEGLAALRR